MLHTLRSKSRQLQPGESIVSQGRATTGHCIDSLTSVTLHDRSSMKSVVSSSADAARTSRPFRTHKVAIHCYAMPKLSTDISQIYALPTILSVPNFSILKDHHGHQRRSRSIKDDIELLTQATQGPIVDSASGWCRHFHRRFPESRGCSL